MQDLLLIDFTKRRGGHSELGEGQSLLGSWASRTAGYWAPIIYEVVASFNWGIVALQYFASFCCKELHQLYGIYLPSLLDSPPMPPSHHSLSPQSTDLSCLCYTTGSHQLYISHMVARTWRPTKCPSTGGWIKKMWYIYIMEYYLAIKGMILGHF